MIYCYSSRPNIYLNFMYYGTTANKEPLHCGEIRDHNSGECVIQTVEQTCVAMEQDAGETPSPKEEVSEQAVTPHVPAVGDPSSTPQPSSVNKEGGDYTAELDGFEDPKMLSWY